jgi:thiamine biosynthesis lipoprotein
VQADTHTHDLEIGADEIVGRTHAMATDIVIRAPLPVHSTHDRATLEAAVLFALDVFTEVQSACTRFDPDSPLMRANARPRDWHRVPAVLFEALVEALRAHEMTDGRFDPRVYADLVDLGYDRTLPFADGGVRVDRTTTARRARPPWHPAFRDEATEVNLGDVPVDLGGIGKGLSVRWAAQRLRRVADDFLVEAGGDCQCAGSGPRNESWRIGVEDPAGAADPVAVVELHDSACTTSSIRLRKWVAGGRQVHHIIDPRTGEPGGEGLASVTVIAPDAAFAEVWSKTLFLAGAHGIAAEARREGIAALWVAQDGTCAMTDSFEYHVIWKRP